jgi:hypothetical protein
MRSFISPLWCLGEITLSVGDALFESELVRINERIKQKKRLSAEGIR